MDSEGKQPERARKKRIPLSRSRRRLNFERRLRLWLWLLGLPALVPCVWLLRLYTADLTMIFIAVLSLVLAWAFAISVLLEEITRPLQTLANVVSALRADDYSFRARGGLRNDSLGDLALELNRLADMMQDQRTGALEAMGLLERVMASMQSPVLAFDPQGRLKLLNAAAEKAFDLRARSALGRSAQELRLDAVLDANEESQSTSTGRGARWMIARTSFRLRGVPHALYVLSDIGAALHEEERLAWERLVRVLGHEINNSLTPIKSIAGSLRSRLAPMRDSLEDVEDFESGLAVIENRAESLNRFLQAYRQLMGLPAPILKPISVAALVQRVALLETRMIVTVAAGADVIVAADEDQIEQALINLVRNAAEAALSPDAVILAEHNPASLNPASLNAASLAPQQPAVTLGWSSRGGEVTISVLDSGPGLSNAGNLFVPFYTTKPSGTGIGLVLAQQIAQAHKGRVQLANRADGVVGCRAELQIPLN